MTVDDGWDAPDVTPGAFDDLDGHTLEELAEYLDAGRMPPNPAIEASPGCQLALESLGRLRGFTAAALAAEAAAEPTPDEDWVQSILTGIAHDVRAGRRIPIAPAEPDIEVFGRDPGSDDATPVTSPPDGQLGMTEGAVRGVIRSAEAAVPGLLIGRCRFDGAITEWGAPTRVSLEVSVRYGVPIPAGVARLRAEVAARLAQHTELNVSGVDIRVRDVQWTPRRTEDDA